VKTKTQNEAPPVLLSDVAGRVFSGSIDSARSWIDRVGGTIYQDWAGRDIVHAETAQKVLEEARRHQAAEAQRQSQYDNYLTNWQREFVSIGERAYQEAATRALEDEQQALRDSDTHWIGLPATVSPRGRSIAQAACNEARARWEAANRRLTYDEWLAKGKR
jgi:hypothetical protein